MGAGREGLSVSVLLGNITEVADLFWRAIDLFHQTYTIFRFRVYPRVTKTLAFTFNWKIW